MATRTPLGKKTTNVQTETIEKQLKAGEHLPEDGPHTSAPQSKPKKQGTKRKSTSQATDEDPAPKRSKAGSTKTKKPSDGLTDVSSIHLPGEEDSTVPIYATCGDIRRQMTAVLQRPKVTQASFCRAISAASHTTVSPRNLSTFRSKKGASSGGGKVVDGADSPAFYAAWVYFEKERLVVGGKKSKHREEMEGAWGKKGMSRHGLKPIWAHASEVIEYDKYGRLVIDGRVCE